MVMSGLSLFSFTLAAYHTSRSPPPRLVATAPAAGTSWLTSLGNDEIHGSTAGAAYYEYFCGLAADAAFATETFARVPKLYHDVPGIANSFTLDDLQVAVDGDFLDAGRGVPDLDAPGGWKMAPVSQPRGASFEDAKMRYVDVEAALKQGTVVFNSAGAHIPPLGTMCLAALDAFGLPNCLNLYCTARGTTTSAPPHTDKQDVFVLQSKGAKRWRVYEPPPPARRPHADPLARGKAHDSLDLSELGEPLIDVVLAPGMVLYVPAGFPHTTDTINTAEAGDAADDDSVHLTIGLDTHIWGVNYLSMRQGALARAKLPDTLNAHTLPASDYWELMGVPPTVGFLGAEQQHQQTVCSELVRLVRLAEPSRWSDAKDDELMETLDVASVASQVERHTENLVQVQRAMYLDAARDVRPTQPGMPRVSIFRVKEHMEHIETAMDEHLQWYGPEAVKRATEAAKAASAPPAGKPAKAKAGGAKVKAATGGFGGGGGGGGSKAKAKGGKKGKKKK